MGWVLGIVAGLITFACYLIRSDRAAYKKALRGKGFYEGRGSVLFPTNLADRPMLKQMCPKAYEQWKEQEEQSKSQHEE